MEEFYPVRKQFCPYEDNGGSVVAMAGEDFALIGADSRLSTYLSICTRDQSKLFTMTSQAVLGATGCWADTLALTRLVRLHLHIYEQEHNKSMTTPALSQMLSNMLYYKRFFPYYVSNIIAGLDEKGRGCVYLYDPVGHCDRSEFHAAGSAGSQLQPLLDNQIGHLNQKGPAPGPLKEDRALKLMKDVFTSAAERDVYTGDAVHISLIKRNGISTEIFGLRKD